MATTSLQSLHQYSLLRRHTVSDTTTTLSSYLFLKPTSNTPSLSHKISFTLSSNISSTSITTTTTPSSQNPTFDLLKQHLISQDFRQADEETRRLIIVLAGESAQKRGYVFFSEAQFISEADLKTLDNLWKEHSNNKFGYSVQKKIWEKAERDFTNLFKKIGWMKKLDTEMEQYNYKAFPNEFIWELNDETPEGHLPLTNALRGTQLFSSILTHPAFQSLEEEDNKEDKGIEVGLGDVRKSSTKPLSNVFKQDYSF
ncbi:hypothetical protein GIB67_009113 [Kingdonia uniflora]|uniref:GUN4-like domain-containing protein n=1 Tax=Kingdonia uniflora TaxID=39325 RepID=A0A7J7N276_9MAGN|nr:hypothetical protein GIB67_009113 [Kingdonia uniflora]